MIKPSGPLSSCFRIKSAGLQGNSDHVHRWISGADVEECHVFGDHQGERQRDAGPAAVEPQLRHQQFAGHHHRNVQKLLRKLQFSTDTEIKL